MQRLFLSILALVASAASAAEVTRVASSFEEKDPFGMYLDFSFNRLQDKGTIAREWYQNGTIESVSELNYIHYQTSLGLDVHLGIFRDLELHFGVPIIFQDDRSWSFNSKSNAKKSTINQNCVSASGATCPTPGSGTDSLFPMPDGGRSSFRSGLGDFTFGLAWAPYVQAKDASKPTWVLRFDYTAPTSALLDPSQATSTTSRGNVGEKLHRYNFTTAVSKRLGPAEPYFLLTYTLPWRGPGYYSNCDHPVDGMGNAQNCGGNGWSRANTGEQPQHTGGVDFGTELTVFERPDRHQRVVFDFRASMRYFSEGRVYNELSDLFGKLLYSGDYGQVGGSFGFVGQAAEFVILRASASIAYNTEHFLTNETIGKDLDGNGSVDVSASPPVELNPNYDFRVDHPGRRFRMTEQFLFNLQVTATFNF